MNQWGDANRQFLETVISQDPKITQTSKSACQLLSGKLNKARR
jgi:hypothetical protein